MVKTNCKLYYKNRKERKDNLEAVRLFGKITYVTVLKIRFDRNEKKR